MRYLILFFPLFFLTEDSLANTPDSKNVLAGRYVRKGEVDKSVEEKFKDLGLVLVPPVLIDELLICPKRHAREDESFDFKMIGTSGYEIFLPQAGVSCVLAELGNVSKQEDGSVVLERIVTLTGEGSRPIRGPQRDRFSKEIIDGEEWLLVDTTIEWVQRSWFNKKPKKYHSLVRFKAVQP
jgi:hypothetical protein